MSFFGHGTIWAQGTVLPTIRKGRDKYHVQSALGQASVTKSFHELKEAEAWARLMGVKADRGDLLT
jgi:hypothetical protein